MENEIDLREIILLLWRGKYIIAAATVACAALAVVYVFVISPPPYETTVFVDPTPYIHEVEDFPYNRVIEDVFNRAVNSQSIVEALDGLDEDPAVLAENIDIEHIEDTPLLILRAVHPDVSLSREMAFRAGRAILEAERDDRLYRLSVHKESLEKSLVELNRYVEANLDEPGKQVYLSWDTGDREGFVLELDPSYRSVLLEKGRLMVELQFYSHELSQIEFNPLLEPSQWLAFGQIQLESTGRLVAVAVSGLLGLFLSVLGIFLHNYLVTSGLIARKEHPVKSS